jgi:hypothetical protein
MAGRIQCKNGRGAAFHATQNEAQHLGLGPDERLGLLIVDR